MEVSEHRYRRLFEAAQDGILILNAITAQIVDVNPFLIKMLGYSREEFLGKKLWDVGSFKKVEVAKTAFNKLQDEHYIRYEDMPLETNDGRLISVEFVSNLYQVDGTSVIQCNIRDITTRKDAERKAEEGLANSYARLQKTFNGAVNTIAAMIEMRDPYTSGHERRVARLASNIAIEIQLPEEKVDEINTAAIIHDIGKIQVPAEILSKLSKVEYSILKAHCLAGYDILKNIEFPYPIGSWILEHHERVNGSGYPNSLTGENISLEAKIIAVADVVEAMASHRPYRPALGIDKALEEISQNKGVLYDAKVVDACLKLFAEGRFKFD